MCSFIDFFYLPFYNKGMKRFVFIVLSLLFAFGLLILSAVRSFDVYSVFSEDGLREGLEGLNEAASQHLFLGIIYTIGSVITLAACLVVIFSRYKGLTPIYEKLKESHKELKEKQESKRIMRKQKRLEKLQAEMDELKKDE